MHDRINNGQLAVPGFKSCPRCGKKFECLHNKNCWCLDFRISQENLEKLRQSFSDCLCPDCLLQYAENKD